MNASQIINNLPYQAPFLFVDALTEISEKGITGNYTFKETAFFYEGHFKENPITPGVLLIETMAQIGVVCLAPHPPPPLSPEFHPSLQAWFSCPAPAPHLQEQLVHQFYHHKELHQKE